PTPSTGEVNATVCPSGESLAPSIGLFQWLICVILAGPLGVVEPPLKRYTANAAAASRTAAPATIYFVYAGFTAGCTAVTLAELLLAKLLAISVACSWTARPAVDEIRPESVSRRSRFKSVRMSDAD